MSMNNVNGQIVKAAVLGGVTGMLKQALSLNELNEIHAKGKTYDSIFKQQKDVSDNKIQMPAPMSLPFSDEVEITDTFTFDGQSIRNKT